MEKVFELMCEEEGRKACGLAGLPHIAAGLEYWFSRQAPLFFLATRYVHGCDLRAYLKRVPGAIAEGRLRAWATQLTEALAAMHERGLVHRDIKPENLLLEQASEQLYIADLGIAKYMQAGTLESLRTMGTHPYAPLEQILGSAIPKSDQYALGVVLFELATGVSALPPVAAPQWGFPVARPALLEPLRYNPVLSVDFAALIERLAAIKPGDRYPSMQAAHKALLRLRRVPPRPRTEPMLEPPTAPLKSSAPVVSAPGPARPAFAWRPFWQLSQAVLGGPIQLGGPALSPGGVVWLMSLYVLWLLASGWNIASIWMAISGHGLDQIWWLSGALAVVLWRVARTWNVRGIERRGSLSVSRRRGLALWCLGGLVAAATGYVALWSGNLVPLWTTAWLESLCGWLLWLAAYISLEIWLN